MSCFVKRILQFKEAIPFSIIYISDNTGIDRTETCKYSWSTDGICWTGWVNYQDYVRIVKNIETDFYLRIQFDFMLGNVEVNHLPTSCYSISIDSTNIFLKNFCEEPNLFNPYANLDCALQLQQQLSDSVICMLGIPIYYFRVIPKEDTGDYTFKEYVLHNVESVKQIKLMIPDGQMPSSNYKLTDFDFDWETDWETELSKTQFATAFGDKAFPKARDFIYVPMMKRMWEVNAAYDEKNEGLMWQSTTWKLSLIKYSEKTNVDNDKFDDIIDSLIVNKYEETFGQLEDNEQRRQVGADPLSSPNYAANNTYNIFVGDAVRLNAYNTNIQEKLICHHSNICARNIYNLSENSKITYQNGICGQEGSLSFIFTTSGLSDKKTKILEFGNINIYIYIKNSVPMLINDTTEIPLEKDNIYIYNCRWDKSTYIINESLYKHIHRNIPIYALKPELYWFDFENPIYNNTRIFNEDYVSKKKLQCDISGPIQICNIKYFNRYLSDEDMYKESIKYVTQDERCVINDLARPLSVGNGYSVK